MREGVSRALRRCAALPGLLAIACAPGDEVTPRADFAPAAWCTAMPRPEYADLERVPLATPDEWFEVYDVGDGVLALYEPHQFQEVVSYLILGDARALLYDTGMGISSIRDVVSRLTDLPVVVVNSHTHGDHVGGNAEFGHVMGLDTGFTRRSAQGTTGEVPRSQVQPEALCAPLPAGLDPETYRFRPFRITERLEPGRVIDLGGRTVEVLPAPGHTPDAIFLLDRENGLLFTGDAYYPGPIYLFAPETDWDAYVQSVERAAALVPDLVRLHPGHNLPVADPAALTRLAEAVRAIDDGSAPFAPDGSRLRYEFDGFAILRPTPGARPERDESRR